METGQTSMKCLGFIMDGNRRWAKEQGLSSYEGHKAGKAVFHETIDWVVEASIDHAVYYAFSTENWKRSDKEVAYLMQLFLTVLDEAIRKVATRHDVRFRVLGRRSDFASAVQKKIVTLEKESAKNATSTTTVWIALSYGGRAEIVTAVNQAVEAGRVVNEDDFNQLLWSAELPDPDMIVRTGGARGLSNFLTWKSVYSELYFLDKNWPALTKADFQDILSEYAGRKRNYGK